MGLKPVGRYVMIEVATPPGKTAGGILLPEDVRQKTCNGVVMQNFYHEHDGLVIDLPVGRKVFWRENPVGAAYMKVDEKDVIFLPPEEIFAVEGKN